ncbi:sugar phosphate isomerase/epimerase family protein [Methylobacterium nodulans]|uniref:Xylose isomerase domain protein TIM barrel n=1 Tax=Methylobacterium nodulans (strain LMG 21967 / CNCM I-2342 / ORS 2060) TaxID=460265 RepID=B8IWC4_METNO|nr:TIM barrel protein [Methylobacterium nodulans]ACL62714.1 Xylose isomerase domain protein TIM barrel [Methylobacterium nodulans ORS 2060]
MHASLDQPLGLAHFTCIAVPPLDLVRLAARTGYASVGLRLHPAFPGAPVYELPPRSAAFREVRQALSDEGVHLHDIEFVTIGEDFASASLTGILEAAAGLGAQRLSVCGDDPDRDRLVARFAELCDLAAEFGMGVDLECMAWRQVASLPDAVRVVENAGRPNGGVLVDALHLSRTGGSPEDVSAVPADLIRSAQLCDAPAEAPQSTDGIIREARAGRLIPGEGALPLGALLAALPLTASLSVEVPMAGTSSPEEHVRANLAAARRLLVG